jgi:hypothetical protein
MLGVKGEGSFKLITHIIYKSHKYCTQKLFTCWFLSPCLYDWSVIITFLIQ